MKIAVVDSGIDVTHKRLTKCKIDGITLKHNENKYIATYDYNDTIGHGTGVAAIIHKSIPDAELYAIKIFDKSLYASEDMLIEALKYCLTLNIDIVNLSLGILTTNPSKELHDICKKLYQNNIIIVSSSNYTLKEKSFPAYFNEVFGVTGGHLKNAQDFGHIKNSPIEFIAKGSLQRVAHCNGGFKITNGPSYACAYFTGIVANTLKANPQLCKNISQIKNYLINLAIPSIKPQQFKNTSNQKLTIVKGDSEIFIKKLLNVEERLKWVGRIAVFPSSEKEMQAFFKFPKMVSYHVPKYFDYPRKLDYTNDNNSIIIDRLPNNDDFNEFDTLVAGYFHEHLFQANVKFGFDFLHKVIENNKNIFLFDRNLKNYIYDYIKDKEYAGKIYLPQINGNVYQRFKYLEYYQPTKNPILTLIGTGSKTGKFTAQLKILQLLKREGYNVCHLSTEPQGELFGSIMSFPYGYNRTVELEKQYWAPCLRSIVKAAGYYRKPHLFVTGTQTWSFPPITNFEPTGNELDTLNFLYGIQPDAVICAINPRDSIDYIKQHTHYLNLYTKAKIIFYTITPWITKKNLKDKLYDTEEYLSDKYLQEKISFYQKSLDLPVINIMDSKNDNFIIKAIEDFFTP
ncbi:MAG: S8 family serine peptidase [Bacteroidales bacterium]|nr:S8 family serine peptidase [Bacteroidales bacterium]